MKGIRDTYSDSFNRLLGNGLKYHVPKFQRDYSWDYEQWDDLWQDIITLLENKETDHYMGYLVLQTSDEKNYSIIDGQQRLTTLCILILAVINTIKKLEEKNIEIEDNKIRREGIHKSFIGDIDYVTRIPQNKLVLNRNNDFFYRQYMVSFQKMPGRGLNSSEKQLKKCFEWFCEKVEKKLLNGDSLAKFVDNITRRLFFTVIKVSDQLNAYKVFETLNARGVQLSSSDLLKNYLFQVIDQTGAHVTEINAIEEQWAKIVDKLGEEKFPEFLRIFWNSKNKTARKNQLYKTIRDNIKSKQQVFDLISSLDNKADVFLALNDPEDELWINKKEIQQGLAELNLFSVKQPIALLMTGYEKLSETEFAKILKATVNISFRYNIIGGLNPNEQEDAYNKIALDINKSGNINWSFFNSIYPNDNQFENDFSIKELKSNSRNDKIAKYILSKFEKYLNGLEVEYLSDSNTLEHVLPKHPNNDWIISDETIERSKFRIGNLLLLEKNINKNIENLSFSEKITKYKESNFPITKDFSKSYSEWDETQISIRQKELAKHAKSIWKISQITI